MSDLPFNSGTSMDMGMLDPLLFFASTVLRRDVDFGFHLNWLIHIAKEFTTDV